MSTSQRSSTSKSTAKPKAASKSKAKSTAKPASASTSVKSASKPTAQAKTPTKSRLAGPKPPKARATSTKAAAPRTTATVTPASPGTSRIPAPKPPVTAKEPLPAELKKPELIDMVVAKADVKKKYAKPVVEAMLEILGETLGKGREMNLQPFGKVKYNRTKETTSARVVVAKVRQSKPADKRSTPPKDPLADAAE